MPVLPTHPHLYYVKNSNQIIHRAQEQIHLDDTLLGEFGFLPIVAVPMKGSKVVDQEAESNWNLDYHFREISEIRITKIWAPKQEKITSIKIVSF